MPKKFLDADGLTHFAEKFNDYPDNEILSTVINAISDELDGKASTALATPSTAGLMSAQDKTVLNNLNPNVSVTIADALIPEIHIINAKQENLINLIGVEEPHIQEIQYTDNLLDVTNNTPGFYIGSNGANQSNTNDMLGDFIPVSPGDDIYYTGIIGETQSSSINRRLHVYDTNQTWIKQLNYASSLHVGDSWSTHGIIPSNGAYVRVSWGANDTHVMISVGEPSKYYPYQITPFSAVNSYSFHVSPSENHADENAVTYTVNLPQEFGNLYCFIYYPIAGKIEVTTGYMASYDGITDLSTVRWWSDRDTWAPNTNPSEGAEVIYILPNGQTIEYDIDPITVPLFYRTNYFWTDNGVISGITYYAETLAADHFTIYNGVTFGNEDILEENIQHWNTAYETLDLKADIESPTFTGRPTAPTPGRAESSTRLATTAFVQTLFGNSIAPIEKTKKATKNYETGEYLMLEGQLYKTLHAISSGTTMTINTDIIATDLVTELNDLRALITSS